MMSSGCDGARGGRVPVILLVLYVSLFLPWGPVALGQAEGRRPIATVHAEVIQVTPDPDDAQDSIATVRIEITAIDKELVVPACLESGRSDQVLCGGNARLVRFNGKTWRNAKPVFGVVMGMEPISNWKPITIPPGDHGDYLFHFSTRLFGVQKGERIRVGFEVWTNPNNIQYNNAAATLLTPAVRIPSN
jgi:hypothetical protein